MQESKKKKDRDRYKLSSSARYNPCLSCKKFQIKEIVLLLQSSVSTLQSSISSFYSPSPLFIFQSPLIPSISPLPYSNQKCPFPFFSLVCLFLNLIVELLHCARSIFRRLKHIIKSATFVRNKKKKKSYNLYRL